MRLTGSRSKTSSSAIVEAAGLDDEIGLALDPCRAACRPRPRKRFSAGDRLGVVDLERGAEDAGQVADVLGDEEVALHEALDAEHAGCVGVAEARGQLGLEVEGQPLLGAAGEEVQVAAHGPEEILGALEAPELGAREDACLDQLVARS